MSYESILKDRRFQRIIVVLLDPTSERFPQELTLRLLQLRYWLCGPSSMKASFDRAGACFGAKHICSFCSQHKSKSFSSAVKDYLRNKENCILFNCSFRNRDFLDLLTTGKHFNLSRFSSEVGKENASIVFYIETNIFLRHHRSDYLEDDVKHFVLGEYKHFGSFSYTKTKELMNLVGEKGVFCAAAQRTFPDILMREPLDLDTITERSRDPGFHEMICAYFATCSGLLQALGEHSARRKLEKLTGIQGSNVNPLESLLKLGHPSFKHD